jgi:hypothetical protein
MLQRIGFIQLGDVEKKHSVACPIKVRGTIPLRNVKVWLGRGMTRYEWSRAKIEMNVDYLNE